MLSRSKSLPPPLGYSLQLVDIGKSSSVQYGEPGRRPLVKTETIVVGVPDGHV